MSTYPTLEAAEEASKLQSAAMSSDFDAYVDFDGQNCEYTTEGENCLGWDGVSYRCVCGNRRVSWSFSQVRPGAWTYYAEAY